MLAGCTEDTEPPVPVITITTQPAAPSEALTEGSITGSLTIAATATEGASVTFQWYGNTTVSNTGGTLISGETSASYALPATLTAGTYHYFCEVGAKGATPVRSSVATVTVNAPEPAIELADPSHAMQTAWADETHTGDGFTFTARAEWTAEVTEGSETRASNVPWVRLMSGETETYGGAAGTHTLVVALEPNYSGADRTATVTLTAAGESIEVAITHAGTREDGTPMPTEVVVFAASGAGNRLVAMKPDGSGKKIIYDGTGAEYDFQRIAMHPEGKKAVVMDGDYNIYVYNLETGTALKIVDGNDTGTAPDEAVWHPNGETILFTEKAGSEFRAHSIKPDGTDKKIITPEGWTLYRANYTPDGNKIIAREDNRRGYIATFDADGSNPMKILETAEGAIYDCPYPVSNERIFYFSATDGVNSLCTAGIDGSNPEPLETFDPKWFIADYLCTNADGTLITYMLLNFPFEPEDEEERLFVVRNLNGTSLGETVFSSDATNYSRIKFGFIDTEIFDSLPPFTD